MNHNPDQDFDDHFDPDFLGDASSDSAPGADNNRRVATAMYGASECPVPRLVILGRPNNQNRESVLLHLDPSLLDRLEALASGSRSLLVEIAIRHMVDELEQIDRDGADADGTECAMLHAHQLDGLVPARSKHHEVPRTSLEGD